MQNIGIFYGSSTGNTETVAKQIQAKLGADNATTFDVADAKAGDIEKFTNIIFGTSTWGIGDLQDDFEGFLTEISNANLNGKKVALFGLGDQYSYSDSFVDGMGEIYEALDNKNCELVGETSTDGYEYDASKAEKDGKLVGLALDLENQDDQTEARVSEWVAELKNQFN
ncbi:flavodoxin [Marinifilum sp.]|uniref:flavodoxin n=1 Tax=Marinifilum sp. TaxID=2033137 RepID=UPI003BA8E13E